MSFYLSLVGYQAVWLTAVIGAAYGTVGPGVVAMLAYALAQLGFARNYRIDLGLIAAGLMFGVLLDGTLIRCGLLTYAACSPRWVPAWILALWIAFALTFSQSLRYLQTRLWLASLLGLLGGPLAYLGASRGWRVVNFTDPTWHGVLALAMGWALAAPALAWLARHGNATSSPATAPRQSA